jgi:hypothetical protein
MNASVNTHAIRQTVFDSASLGVLCTICHPLIEPGEYSGMIYRGDLAIARFSVNCNPHCTATQVDLDLAAAALPGTDPCSPEVLEVKPEGFLVLYVSTGAAGYHVTLHGQSERHKGSAFDSRKLGEHDLFVTTLLRPGHYEMASSLSKERGGVTVSYPEIGKIAHPTHQAQAIECSAKGFSPSAAKLLPGQGLIFKIMASNAAVRLSLKDPDDGPPCERDGKVYRTTHWDNPNRSRDK